MHSKEELPVWSIIASDGGGQSSKSTKPTIHTSIRPYVHRTDGSRTTYILLSDRISGTHIQYDNTISRQMM